MPIPVGTHEAAVVSTVLGKTSTGKEQIAVTFRDEAGNESTWYGYFTEKTTDRTLETLIDVLGWDTAADNGEIQALNGTERLVGKRAQLVVENETYDGKTRAKIRWVNSLGGGVKEVMPENEAAAFSAKLRAKIMTRKGGTRPAPAKAVTGQCDPITQNWGGSSSNDDIPF